MELQTTTEVFMKFIIKLNNTRNFPAYVGYLVRYAQPGVNTDNEFYKERHKAKQFDSREAAEAIVEKLHANDRRNGGRIQCSSKYIVEVA